MAKKPLTVLLLAGGDSAERDVSLDSSRGMARAAVEAGHRVFVADPARPDIEPAEDWTRVFGDAKIGALPPDVVGTDYIARMKFVGKMAASGNDQFDIVLNGLHGGAGEDGTIQAILAFIGVSYTGSGAGACALAMDKHRSKHVARSVGVPVAKDVLLSRSVAAAGAFERAVLDNLSLPVVVKPNNQGSSVGLTVVTSVDELEPAARRAFALDDYVLVEEYIAGREITAAILEGTNLPLLEIKPLSGLYDYYHKYQSGASEYLVPAPLDDPVADAIAASAKRAFETLGCRVYGRVDFRLGDDGQHYFLEANTYPGMTSTSLVPVSYTHLTLPTN